MKNFKNLLLITLLLGASISTHATRSPIRPWITSVRGDVTFSSEGDSTLGANKVTSAKILDGAVTSAKILNGTVAEADLVVYTGDGLLVKRTVRVTYDTAVDGGTVAAHTLGVTIPAKALMVNATIYIETQFVDAGSGTVAIHCEDANNILTATDITGNADGSIIAATITDSAKVASISADCVVTATVAVIAQTAGKLIVFIEYYIHD